MSEVGYTWKGFLLTPRRLFFSVPDSWNTLEHTALEYKHRLTHSAFNRPEALWGCAVPVATPGTAGSTLVSMESSREKKMKKTEVREMTSVPRQMLGIDKVKKVSKSVRKVLGMGILWLADPDEPLP